MSRLFRPGVIGLIVGLMLLLPFAANAQRRPAPRHPPHPQPSVVVRGQVFIGGYFYDPFFGPYPWWPRTAYPYWYFPVYDNRADVRIQVEPEDTAVYVDGFYAGIVDDFNGVFQALPLPPGGHTIVLYREGYRTITHSIYLRPGSTFRLRENMLRLPPGAPSEPPPLAPPVPAPPPGSYSMPRTAPPPLTAQAPPAVPTGELATLDIYVQPPNVDVSIDGRPWLSSDEGHFVVDVPEGRHRIEVSKAGYRTFSTEIDAKRGETVPLNVSLVATTR
jgi:hypothetical protein